MDFNLKRREAVVLTIIEIIDELGYQGFTTKEVCKRQKISEGTLYKHYKSKQDMTMDVLEYYSSFDDIIIKTIQLSDMNPKEGIVFFVTRFAEYYQSYPAITSILNSYEVLRHEEVVGEKIKQIFLTRLNFLSDLIEKGKEEGLLSLNVKSDLLATAIQGYTMSVVLKWKMLQYSFSLKDAILNGLDMLLGY